jgi:hypothetical protein
VIPQELTLNTLPQSKQMGQHAVARPTGCHMWFGESGGHAC